MERHWRSSAAVKPAHARPASQDRVGVVTGLPLALLRSEGLAVLATAVVLYGRYGMSWCRLVPLLPAPALGLLGNLWSRRAGAVAYDLTHTSVGPAALGILGVLGRSRLAVALAPGGFGH